MCKCIIDLLLILRFLVAYFVSGHVLQLKEVTFFNTVVTTKGGMFVQNPRSVLGQDGKVNGASTDSTSRASKTIPKRYFLFYLSNTHVFLAPLYYLVEIYILYQPNIFIMPTCLAATWCSFPSALRLLLGTEEPRVTGNAVYSIFIIFLRNALPSNNKYFMFSEFITIVSAAFLSLRKHASLLVLSVKNLFDALGYSSEQVHFFFLLLFPHFIFTAL